MEVRGWESDRSVMFASAKVWIVPSLWEEPFGRVSIEAQAANRPVLVIKKGGLPETVANQKYVISGFNVEAWLDRIRILLSLPGEEIERNGSLVRHRFSREAHDQRIGEIFQLW